MARVPLVARNWKMNGTVEQALVLVDELRSRTEEIDDVEILICPPSTALSSISEQLVGSGIAMGAQHMHWERSGAYSGEISALMTRKLCSHIIIGHFERRAYLARRSRQ